MTNYSNKILTLLIIIFIGMGCKMLGNSSDEKTDTAEKADSTETLDKDEAPTPETEDSNKTADLENQKDLLSIGAGAYFVKASSEYTPDTPFRWSGIGLIDESSSVGWSATKNTVSDQSIVFELPAETTLKTIVFDTADVGSGEGAKNVSVEISKDSAESGFETILSASLKDKTNRQQFQVEKEITGRFVKINAKSNHGSDDWLKIMEIRGYGEQKPQPAFDKNVSGTYQGKGGFGKFHIRQEGTQIVGCYENGGGVFEGGLDGRIATLDWRKSDGKKEDKYKYGPATLLFGKEGKKFSGFSGKAANDYFDTAWKGEKISDEVGNCEHYKNLSEENAAKNKIEEELKKEGRIALYGINFDFNSDKIREESKQTLDQVVNILKENTDWKMTIEGHTDNIGGESFNQTLSEKRANAVKKYLTDAGIDESRLSAKGAGMSSPVAKNDTEAGRARNRRVELVRE